MMGIECFLFLCCDVKQCARPMGQFSVTKLMLKYAGHTKTTNKTSFLITCVLSPLTSCVLSPLFDSIKLR